MSFVVNSNNITSSKISRVEFYEDNAALYCNLDSKIYPPLDLSGYILLLPIY
jgi:hypothetical protein